MHALHARLAALTPQQRAVGTFTALYVAAFSAYYIAIRDWEFLWYVAVMLALIFLILFTIERTGFGTITLWGLSIWGLLHMAGGGVPVNDSVLYAHTLIHLFGDGEFTLLKYDQAVHAFGFGVATLALYELFAPHWRGSRGLLAFAAAVGAMGLGAINEIVEFAAVVVAPETGVGGYYNTALDLVFNAVGAIAVALWLYTRARRNRSVERRVGL